MGCYDVMRPRILRIRLGYFCNKSSGPTGALLGHQNLPRLHISVDDKERYKASIFYLNPSSHRKTKADGKKEFTQVTSGTVHSNDGWSYFTANFTVETGLTSNAVSLEIYLGGSPIDATFYLDQVKLDALVASNLNKGRKNILFIGVDDLRPNLGTYASVTSATLRGHQRI